MTLDILADRSAGQTRAALVDDDRLIELLIERDDAPSLLDAIYLGRITRVVPGLNGAFVDLGDAGSGFLSARRLAPRTDGERRARIGRRVHEGQWLIVQVIGEAVDDKGPVLSADVRLIGAMLVYQPFGDGITCSHRLARRSDAEAILARATQALDGSTGGHVIRRAGGDLDPARLAQEAAMLHARWRDISAAGKSASRATCLEPAPDIIRRCLRDWTGTASIIADGAELSRKLRTTANQMALPVTPKVTRWQGRTPLFEARGIETEIEAAGAPCVPLAGGGSLIIAETAALTAIDVNAGRRGETGGAASTAFDTNRLAAMELARQLRLRRIGGAIVIDFIRLRRREDRRRLIAQLTAAFADDPAAVDIYGWTRLGHVEMVRHARGRRLSHWLPAPGDAG